MSIVGRIRANGGRATLNKWRVKVRPGRLTKEAMAWIKEHRRELIRELWVEFDDWEERAAIREIEGGMSREEAEAAAYEDVCRC